MTGWNLSRPTKNAGDVGVLFVRRHLRVYHPLIMRSPNHFGSVAIFRVVCSLLLAIGIAGMSHTVLAQAEGGAIAAIDEGSGGAPARKPAQKKKPAAKLKGYAGTAPREGGRRVYRGAPVPAAQPTASVWKGDTLGDKYSFLNFEMVSAEKPIYTKAAKAAGAKGLVQVEIEIDQNGNVISAHARTGNALLHPEAERAGARIDI